MKKLKKLRSKASLNERIEEFRALAICRYLRTMIDQKFSLEES